VAERSPSFDFESSRIHHHRVPDITLGVMRKTGGVRRPLTGALSLSLGLPRGDQAPPAQAWLVLQPGDNLLLEALRSVTVAALCRAFTTLRHRPATVTERRAERDADAPGISECAPSHGTGMRTIERQV
jgi:hypothetical protein